MCAIAGLINWGSQGKLQSMLDIQAHRGPDDEGIWQSHAGGMAVGLGSRRLSILDLSSAGRMPMVTEDGGHCIAYNGEIYNYREIRASLEAKGCRFRSRSDTEAVLLMYQQYGADSVRRLNGMFAFAIWDVGKQELFIARDHFGIKPLYYAWQGERFAFASEAKALLSLTNLDRSLNYQALQQFLTFLWVPEPLTMFNGVQKLLAGHYGVFKGSQLTLTQYWDLEYPPVSHTFPAPVKKVAVELRDRFTEVVRSQLLSDVPVGAFLSAGLDSSSIVGTMHQLTSHPISTFTISFPPKYRVGEINADDPEVARKTAKEYGCNHTEIEVEPNVVELLPKLVWHLDEPIADPAVMAAYLVNCEARKQVKVLLSGVGGDELFGGYRKYMGHYLANYYRRIPQSIRRSMIEIPVMGLPNLRGSRLKGYIRLAKKMVSNSSLSPQNRFLADSTYLSKEQVSSLCNKDLLHRMRESNPFSTHERYFENVRHADFLNQMLYLDIKTFMVSLNLTYNDRMSMAASVEVRVPFLDWKFAEWVALNVSPELKIHLGQTKHILRRAMEPILPKDVLRQKKAGFGAPTDYWLANDLKDVVDDLLSERSIRDRGLFVPKNVRNLVDQHRSGAQDWSAQIWQLLTLELWMRVFIDAPTSLAP